MRTTTAWATILGRRAASVRTPGAARTRLLRLVVACAPIAVVGPVAWQAGPVVGSHPWSIAVADPSNPVVVIAGDIACSPSDPDFSGSNPSDCQQQATAQLVHNINPDYLMPGGDTQYLPGFTEGVQPGLSDFQNGYGASWGQLQNPSNGLFASHLVRVAPTPGDHEYGDANENDRGAVSNASNYYSYFSSLGDLPGTVTGPSNDFYAFDVTVGGSTWNLVSLDGQCAALPNHNGGPPSQDQSGCASGSPQEAFLQQDLASHQGDCILLHWHEPAWSEGINGSGDADYQAFWNDAYQFHVTAIVNGHDHDYERWKPLNASGNPDPNGVDEIVAGTGGNSLTPESRSSSDVVADDFSHFGVLQLTLHAGSASFAFKTVGGGTADSGTINCHPGVSGLSAGSGPTAGGNTVTITGNNFTGTPSVHFGNHAASHVTVTSPTSLTATAPSASPGMVDVTVTNDPPTGVGGSGPTSDTSPADEYTYLSPGSSPPPTITAIAPHSGSGSGGSSVTITGTNLTGASAVTFGTKQGTNIAVNSGGTSLTVTTPAGAVGSVNVSVTTPGGTSGTLPYTYVAYWMVGSDGGVFSFGGAKFFGSLPADHVAVNDIVALVPTHDGGGYWMIGGDGGVFAFGDAGFVGSIPGLSHSPHVSNIVGAVPTASGKGYWMVGSDGGVFAFGDATFVGSIPALGAHVNDVVAVVPTSTGKGYWMIGQDGGVFAFGDAGFVGSIPGLSHSPHVSNIVGAVPTASGKGYWMVGSDGGVFAFGDATFVGSIPGLPHAPSVSNVVGVVATPDNRGYWMVGNDGGVFAFGDATFVGSIPGLPHAPHINNIVAFAPQ